MSAKVINGLDFAENLRKQYDLMMSLQPEQKEQSSEKKSAGKTETNK